MSPADKWEIEVQEERRYDSFTGVPKDDRNVWIKPMGKDHPKIALVCVEKNDMRVANLLCAAPDMLEALKEVVALSDRKHVAWDKAHAVIARAEGREGGEA